jgi:phytoene desaturase
MRNRCFEKIVKRMEAATGQSVKEHIVFSESFGVRDFESQYHSFKGNAYGLANTLRQTAFLRPKLRSPKVLGLYFAGQLTVPGPGVPPALISGKLAAQLIQKHHERTI